MTGAFAPKHAGGGWDFERTEGTDIEDFLDEVEADELADDGGDHEAALDAWRQAQEEDGGDELECGLTRSQLRTAARVLFGGLGEIFNEVLKSSHRRPSKDGAGSKNGAVVSAAMVAGVAVALELPGFERSSTVAKSIQVTRAGVSIHAARFGRMLGTTSEASARKQREGILARARQLAGMGPRCEQVIHRTTAEELREKPETREWLASLPEDEREEARKALRGRV